MESGLRRGHLTKWKDERGFGFIRPVDGSKEVFLHVSALTGSTRRPKIGDTICYRTTIRDGKIRACDAFIVGARQASKSSLTKFLTNRNTAVIKSRLVFSDLIGLFLLLILPFFGAVNLALETENPLWLMPYPVISLVTFATYADDKSRAQTGKWRVQEKFLHMLELAGGWPGGFLAQKQLRHKNRKRSYQLTFWAIVALHNIMWLGWLLFPTVLVDLDKL